MITLYGTKDDASPTTMISGLVIYDHWFNNTNANRFNQILSDWILGLLFKMETHSATVNLNKNLWLNFICETSLWSEYIF